MGVPYDAIAQNCRLSPETVRTYLKRSLKNLNLEGYDALRSAVLMRTFVFMISNTAKENEKCEQVSPLKGTLYGNCILHFTGDPKLININTKHKLL